MADYINTALKQGRIRFGREMTPDELGSEFEKHGIDARTEHLASLEWDEFIGAREASKRLQYERALNDTHARLRRIER